MVACVGATGFEPATAWSQTRSATGLRYTPLHIKPKLFGLSIFCGCKGKPFFLIVQVFKPLFY